MSRDPQASLTHVRWLGGAAGTGKTAVAERLAADHGLTIYSCDRHFDEHASRVDRDRHPHFHSIMNRSCEELWMRPPPEQVAELVGFYGEELDMVVEDLVAMRGAGRVLVEGAGLLPARVHELARRPDRAVWLQAGSGLRRCRIQRRPRTPGLLARCTDPEEAFRRWMERDDRFAAWIAAEARRLGERVLAVGGRTLEETAAEVARRLGLAR